MLIEHDKILFLKYVYMCEKLIHVIELFISFISLYRKKRNKENVSFGSWDALQIPNRYSEAVLLPPSFSVTSLLSSCFNYAPNFEGRS